MCSDRNVCGIPAVLSRMSKEMDRERESAQRPLSCVDPLSPCFCAQILMQSPHTVHVKVLSVWNKTAYKHRLMRDCNVSVTSRCVTAGNHC